MTGQQLMRKSLLFSRGMDIFRGAEKAGFRSGFVTETVNAFVSSTSITPRSLRAGAEQKIALHPGKRPPLFKKKQQFEVRAKCPLVILNMKE